MLDHNHVNVEGRKIVHVDMDAFMPQSNSVTIFLCVGSQ
jgi:hypothetical protein